MIIVPSHHTTKGAYSREHKERCDIIPDEEWYILVKVLYRTPNGSGKYTGFGFRIETGAERTTIVDSLRHNPARRAYSKLVTILHAIFQKNI